jgi:hypothetical protein
MKTGALTKAAWERDKEHDAIENKQIFRRKPHVHFSELSLQSPVKPLKLSVSVRRWQSEIIAKLATTSPTTEQQQKERAQNIGTYVNELQSNGDVFWRSSRRSSSMKCEKEEC